MGLGLGLGLGLACDGDEEDAARKEGALVYVVRRGEGERGLAHTRRADEGEQALLLADGGRDQLLHLLGVRAQGEGLRLRGSG